MIILFWVCLGTLWYVYAGYPLLVWLLAQRFGQPIQRRASTPTVSLLLPVYNEEAHIEEKLRNSLALRYPKGRLDIVVANDGSTDRTAALVKPFCARGVRLITYPHVGKSAMISRTVPRLRGEIVVFSDATIEVEPDALRRLVRNFADPRVGCVSGSYGLRRAGDLRAQGEGIYWRYESFLKLQESRLHSTLGAHGPCYAIRKELFQRIGKMEINDDYLIPMRILEQGYRVVYDPDVITWERELVSVEGEFARRRRIAVGNCQQTIALRRLLSPRFGLVALCFFSHKVLRTAAPLVLLMLLGSSFWLPARLAAVMLILQGLLYTSAFLGYLCQRWGRVVRWLSPPFYFCFGNLAMLTGLLRYCFSPRRYTWERAR